MDLDAILAAQMSVDNFREDGAVDGVDPFVIADRIDAVQSSAEKAEFGTDHCPAILRKFIDHGVITPDGEILIEWLEAGPSSSEDAPRCAEQFDVSLSKRMAELPDAIRLVYVLDHADFLMLMENLQALCCQHRTGSQALRYLEQTGGKLAPQDRPDRSAVLIPPAPSFSITGPGTGCGLSDEPAHLRSRTSPMVDHDQFYWKNRLLDFAKSPLGLILERGECGMSMEMDE